MTPPGPSLRRGARAWRLARRGLAWFAAVATLASVVGYLVLQSAWGRDQVRRRLVAALQAGVDGRVTIGALDGSLLGTPTLRDVAIADPDGHVLIRVASARVDHALWPLLTGERVHLRRVEVSGADVRLERDPDGTWNLARLVARRGDGAAGARRGGASVRLTVDRIELVGGQVVVDANDTHTTWRDVTLRGGLSLQDGRLEVAVRSLRARWVEGDRGLDFVGAIDADAGHTRLTIGQLLLGTSSASAPPVELGEDGAVAASLTVQLGAADVRALLPGLPFALQRGATVTARLTRARAGTPLDVELEARITGQPVSATAKLSVADGRATGTAALTTAEGSLTATGAVATGTGRLVLEDVRVHARTGRLARGEWALAASELAATVAGAWPTLAVTGELSARRLGRGELVAAEARARFELTGIPSAPAGSADLELDGVDAGATRIGPVRARVRAPAGAAWLETSVHAGTRTGAFALDAELSVAHRDPRAVVVRVGGARLRTRRVVWTASGGELTWQRDGRAASVRGLTLASPAARVDVDGALGPAPGLPGVGVRVTIPDLGRVRAALASDRLPVEGRATLDARVTGAWSAPSVRFTVDTAGLVMRPGASRLDGRLSGRLGGGRGSLVASLSGAGATLEASASGRVPVVLWDAPAWRRLRVHDVAQARLHASGVALVRLPAALRVPGTIGRVALVDAQLDRRDGRTRGHLRARLEDLRPAAAARAVDADLDLRLDDDVIALTASVHDDAIGRLELRAEASAPPTPWDVAAWRRPGATRLRTVELTLAGLDLAEAFAFAGLGVAPVTGRVDGRVQLGDAGALTSAGSAQGPLGSVTWNLTAVTPTDPFDVAAWSRLDDRALRTARVDVRGVELAPLVDRARPGLVGAGVLDGSLTVVEPGQPAVIALSVRQVKARHARRLVAGSARVELAETETRAHAKATLGELPLVHGDLALAVGLATLRAQGPRGFGRALLVARARGDAHIDALPAQVVADELELRQRLGGTLHADATLTGSLAAPALSGRVDAQDARVDGVAFAVLTGTWRVDGGGRVVLRAQAQQADGGSLSLEGSTSTAPGAPIDVSLSAQRFSVAVLGVLARLETDRVLGAEGRLDAEVRATGAASAPTFEGHAEIADGRLHVESGLPPLTGVSLTATFSGRRIMARATGQARRGRLAVTATLELDGWTLRAADGSIEAEQLPVTAGQRVITTDVSASFSARHSRDGWDADARVRRSLLRFPRDSSGKLDVGPLADVIYVDARERRQERGRAEPFRLHVVAPDTLVVESKDAGVRATLNADLHISIVDGETSINGKLRSVRGRVVLFDRPYNVTVGEATFDGRTLDPRIDVQLVEDFGSVTITIKVSRTRGRTKVDLVADPPIYDQAQLLAIVLGKNPDERTSDSLSLEQGAANVATAVIMGQLGSALGGRLPIDVIEIDPGDETGQRTSGVRVGKWLTENLFVVYRHGSVADELENVNQGELEYRLGLRWILQGVYGDRGKGGVDVLWIWRY